MPSASDFRRYAAISRADELDYLAKAKTSAEPRKSLMLKWAAQSAADAEFYISRAEIKDWLDEQKHNQERAA